eukprot:748144-Hanusia_phi.AAC.3
MNVILLFSSAAMGCGREQFRQLPCPSRPFAPSPNENTCPSLDKSNVCIPPQDADTTKMFGRNIGDVTQWSITASSIPARSLRPSPAPVRQAVGWLRIASERQRNPFSTHHHRVRAATTDKLCPIPAVGLDDGEGPQHSAVRTSSISAQHRHALEPCGVTSDAESEKPLTCRWGQQTCR